MSKRTSMDKIPKEGHHSFIHGHRYASYGKPTSEYQIWSGIKKRIHNPNCNIYQYYGGRGLDMDPRWDEFVNFLSDVGHRPSVEYSLDRLDNSKGYWKDNVRWATRTEQSRNRRNNIMVDWTGEDTCLKEACVFLGWRYKVVWSWVKRGRDFVWIKARAEELWDG